MGAAGAKGGGDQSWGCTTGAGSGGETGCCEGGDDVVEDALGELAPKALLWSAFSLWTMGRVDTSWATRAPCSSKKVARRQQERSRSLLRVLLRLLLKYSP